MAETFTFYDKDTGDLIQTGPTGTIDANNTATRAIADFQTGHFGYDAPELHVFRVVDAKNASVSDLDSIRTLSNLTNTKSIEIAVSDNASSPCSKKPRVIAPTHFCTSMSSFADLKRTVDGCLVLREELVFSYFPRKQTWKCKYLEGSQSREVHISCFWDSCKKDHVLEVKRVQGDGLFPQYTDLLTVLKQGLGVDVAIKKAASKPVGRIPPPCALRREYSSSESFLESIRIVLEMSRNQYYEPRLEASKMLCDIVCKQPIHLMETSNVEQEILEVLMSFIQDQFDDVVEFGVVCLHNLVSKSIQYRRAVVNYNYGSIVSGLIAHIRNCDFNHETGENDFYLYAQMRRLAGKTLNELVQCVCCSECDQQRRCLSIILQQAGFFCCNDWKEYVGQLADPILRESVFSVSRVY